MDIQEARQLARRPNRSGVQDQDYFPLAGGLNLVATPLQLAPGELLGSYNYEPRTQGGYRRIVGYERLDGRTLPSLSPYYLFNFISGIPTGYPNVGQTINGQTSGATAIVLVATVLDGTGLAGQLIIWSITGTFLNGEILRVGITPFGTSSGTPASNAASTDALNDVYQVAAREAQRALVLPVPGSGPVLGVVTYKGVDYAFRNNSNGTAALMYRATAVGWVAVPQFPVLTFKLGTSIINAGDTITGVTSTNTATVRRVVVATGSWDAGTAAGYLVLAAGSPAFVTAEVLNVAAVGSATTVGTAVAPTLAPNGRYTFRVANFYGSTGTMRLYGTDYQNKGFEYQDSPEFFNQITTGMANDRPTHPAVHRGRLWLAFPGGSLQPSAVNDPAVYSALQGAAELTTGDDITDMLEEMNPSQSQFYSTSTLFVFCAGKTMSITGDGPNWVLGNVAPDTGALPFSAQRIGHGVFLNDLGFSTITQAASLDNFKMASFSDKINPLLPQIRQKAVCSSVSKNYNLYRMFLSDGTYLACCFSGTKMVGMTVCDLLQPMSCAWNGSDPAHNDHTLLGGANGYVYLMDSGVNLDGAAMTAFFRTAYGFNKTPSRQKRYRRAQLDVAADGNCTLSVVPDYSFGDPTVQTDAVRKLTISGGGGYWDVSLWDQFKWDNAASQAPTIKLESSGLNIAFVVSHSSTNEPQHVIQGISLHHSQRRLDRSSQA